MSPSLRTTRVNAVALAAMLCSACAAASNPEVDMAAEEAALRAASKAVQQAEAAKNVDLAVSYWTSDAFLHVPFAPQMEGTEQLRSAYPEFFASFDTFTDEITALEIAQSGDVAWLTGRNHYTKDGVTTNGKFLTVWRKIDGKWKVAGIAVSDDAPPTRP